MHTYIYIWHHGMLDDSELCRAQGGGTTYGSYDYYYYSYICMYVYIACSTKFLEQQRLKARQIHLYLGRCLS